MHPRCYAPRPGIGTSVYLPTDSFERALQLATAEYNAFPKGHHKHRGYRAVAAKYAERVASIFRTSIDRSTTASRASANSNHAGAETVRVIRSRIASKTCTTDMAKFRRFSRAPSF